MAIRDEKKIALSAAAKKAVAAYLQKPNPHATLIVYVSLDLSRDDYKQLKKEKLARLRENLESPHTVSIDLDRTGEAEIRNFIKGYMKERKITITRRGHRAHPGDHGRRLRLHHPPAAQAGGRRRPDPDTSAARRSTS